MTTLNGAQLSLATAGRNIFTLLDEAENPTGSHNDERIQEFKTSVSAQSQRFRIWATDLGLLVPGHGSLDYRVREADNIHKVLDSYLNDLTGYLRDTVVFVSSASLQDYLTSVAASGESGYADESLEDDSDDEAVDQYATLSVLMDAITDAIDHLFKLSTKIRNPPMRAISSKARTYRLIDQDSGVDLVKVFEHYDYDHACSIFQQYYQNALNSEQGERISEFWPTKHTPENEVWHSSSGCTQCMVRSSIQIAPCYSPPEHENQHSEPNSNYDIRTHYLVRRLAKANLQRRQRFMYWEEHHKRKESHTTAALAPRRQPQYHLPGGAIDDPVVNIGPPKEPGVRGNLGHADSVTTATQLSPAAITTFGAHSTYTISEYAPSNYNTEREAYDFPSPPKVDPGVKSFQCPYCFAICPAEMLSERAWRAHLIHDLRPYVCTYPDCNSASLTFDARREWTNHENSAHRRYLQCPNHREIICLSERDFLNHLTSEHGEEAGTMSTDLFMRSCEAFSEQADRPCPFCFSSLETVSALNSHIARHLERLSLFSLPRSRDESEESDNEANNSTATINDAQTSCVGSSRSAVYSVDKFEGFQIRLKTAVADDDEQSLKYVLHELEEEFQGQATLEPRKLGLLQHALAEACRSGSLHAADILLTNTPEMPLDLEYNLSLSPLVNAARSGEISLVKMILNRTSKVHIDDALIASAARGDCEIGKLLIQQGARVDTERPVTADGWRTTPLLAASEMGHSEMVWMLLCHGADPNHVVNQKAPILEVLEQDNLKILHDLISVGADVNLVVGNTSALLIGSQRGKLDAVRMLLQKGADPNNPHTPISPLDEARSQGHHAIAQLLEEYGAKITPGQMSDDTATSNIDNDLPDVDTAHYKDEETSLQLIRRNETEFGPKHIKTLNAVKSLGNFYDNRGRAEKAEKMYLRALQGYEEALGPIHGSITRTLEDLATLYSLQRRYEEAESMYARVLGVYEKTVGPEHQLTLRALYGLGTTYRERNKLAQAEECFQRVSAGYEKKLGPDHYSTLGALYTLGGIYKGQGKLAQAEESFQRASAGYEKRLGPENDPTLSALYLLGDIYEEQDKLAQAEECYQRVMAGCEKIFGLTDHRARRAGNRLMDMYRKQGRIEEADELMARLPPDDLPQRETITQTGPQYS